MDHNALSLSNGHNSTLSIFGDMDVNDLAPKTLSFQMGDPPRWYVLREATKGADVHYRRFQLKNMVMVEKEGERQLQNTGVGDADPQLLSQCLYYGDEHGRLALNSRGDPDPKNLVPIHIILSWPTRITDPLVKRVKEMSNIEQERTREQLEKDIKDATEALKKLDSREKRESEGADPTTSQAGSIPSGAP